MKNEFVNFLKQYRIYDAFIIDLKKYGSHSRALDPYIKMTSPHDYIMCAFSWINDPKIKWNSYHDMWVDYIERKSSTTQRIMLGCNNPYI